MAGPNIQETLEFILLNNAGVHILNGPIHEQFYDPNIQLNENFPTLNHYFMYLQQQYTIDNGTHNFTAHQLFAFNILRIWANSVCAMQQLNEVNAFPHLTHEQQIAHIQVTLNNEPQPVQPMEIDLVL